jgi:translocation and assembly module TamA
MGLTPVYMMRLLLRIDLKLRRYFYSVALVALVALFTCAACLTIPAYASTHLSSLVLTPNRTNPDHTSQSLQEISQTTSQQTNKLQAAIPVQSQPDSVDQTQSILGLSLRFKLETSSKSASDLLLTHIALLAANAEPQVVTRGLLRKLRNEITAIIATEGYFSPNIRIEKSSDSEEWMTVFLDVGERARIKELRVNFSGALIDQINEGNIEAIQRRDQLLQAWPLTEGKPFRDDDWSKAKTLLLAQLHEHLYAAASIVDSRAAIDAETNSVVLELDVHTGPPFYFGDVFSSGLQRYPLWLIDRFNPPKKGEAFSNSRLQEFQRAMQNSSFFSSVFIGVEPDVTKADALPIEIVIVEKQLRDLGFGIGYSSNTGFRGELSYRDRNAINQVWDLRSAIRLEQKRQLAYADVYLPPRNHQDVDSFGVLLDRLDVENVVLLRRALGVKRSQTRGAIEHRYGVNFTQETATLLAAITLKSQALVGNIGWTWRNVDDVFSPRDGTRVQLDIAFAEKSLASDQRFIRYQLKYQHWFPIQKENGFIFRGEIGQVFAKSTDGIPQDYLFRTGGSTTVRGYAYQSIGMKEENSVIGGRVTAVASAEYVRWVAPSIGIAAFFDAGDASSTWKEFKAKQGYGLGARLKTPAGPIAVDVAYGHQSKQVRLDFSIAIAF